MTRGGVSSGDLVSFILYELQFSSAVEVRNKDSRPIDLPCPFHSETRLRPLSSSLS